MKLTSLLAALALCLLGCGSDNDLAPAGDNEGTTTIADAAGTPPTDTSSNTATGEDVASEDEEDNAPQPEPEEPPTGADCNPIAGTGCADGEKCIYDESNLKTCVPAGDTPGGSPCQDTSECIEGMCLQLNGTDSYCYTFCKTIGHCPNNAPCLEIQDAPYKVCKIDDLYDNCDILAQDCEEGKGCYSVAGEDQPVCIPAGTSPLGGECQGPSDCAPGTHCVNFRCYELCDKNDPEACGLFGKCSSVVSPGVGYCDEQQG